MAPPLDDRARDTLRDHARGTLLGLAVGDALGGPLERLSPAGIRARYGGPVREMVGGGWLRLAPGQGTDDTAMALALARAAAPASAPAPAPAPAPASAPAPTGGGSADLRMRALAGYLRWYATDPPDIGETTRAALSAGPDPEAVARAVAAYRRPPGRGGGNGSLMRAAPLGVRFGRDARARARAAREDSALTHADPVAADACAYLCDVIAALVRAPGTSAASPGAPADVPAPPATLREAWTRSAAECAAIAAGRAAGLVTTTLSVTAAALREAATFEEGLVWAVNLGGDADTNGAVAGALLGARHGARSIPERWLTPLRAGAEMSELADRLLAAGDREGADSGGV